MQLRVSQDVQSAQKGVSKEEAIAFAKSACLDIVTDILRQHNEDRKDFHSLENRIVALEQADTVHLATSTKVRDDLCPETFWKLVFIEKVKQESDPEPLKKYAKIPFQLAKLWRIFKTKINEKNEFTALNIIEAINDYVKSGPAPGTFKIAVDKLFSILKLWNFDMTNINIQFQQKLVNEHMANLAAKHELKRKNRATFSADFVETLLNKNFGSDQISKLSDFVPTSASLQNCLDALLTIAFLQGNRSPEFDNIKLGDLAFFVSQKTFKIVQLEGRIVTIQLNILKNKSSHYQLRKSWTLLLGVIEAEEQLKKRNQTITLLPAGKAFLYLYHFRKSDTSLLPNFCKLNRLAYNLSLRVKEIYSFLGRNPTNVTYYSGKHTLVSICLILKLPVHKIVQFIGWKGDNTDTYSNDPTLSLNCAFEEFPEILAPLIKANVKLANKASLLKVFRIKQ